MRSTRLSRRSDLAAGTVTGSLPGSAAETDASNQLNGSGGTAPLTYALVTGGNAATAGTFGTIQVNTDGSYIYTLTSAVRHQPGRRQRRQHRGGGELHLCGDRRQRQHRDRHHHGQHRRRRSDGECGTCIDGIEADGVTGNVLTDRHATTCRGGRRDGDGGRRWGFGSGSRPSRRSELTTFSTVNGTLYAARERHLDVRSERERGHACGHQRRASSTPITDGDGDTSTATRDHDQPDGSGCGDDCDGDAER